jgi:hypothetical protein
VTALIPLPIEADLPEAWIYPEEAPAKLFPPCFEEGRYFLLISSRISMSFELGPGGFVPSPAKLLLMMNVGL